MSKNAKAELKGHTGKRPAGGDRKNWLIRFLRTSLPFGDAVPKPLA